MKRTNLLKGLAVATLVGLVAPVMAQVPKTITVDGNAQTEWAAADVIGTQSGTSVAGATARFENMKVTWDNEYLYIGIDAGANSQTRANTAITVFVDGNFTGSNNLGWSNTTFQLTDTSSSTINDPSPPFTGRDAEAFVSDLNILFPGPFKADLFATSRANETVIDDSAFTPSDVRGGVRTWNSGDPNNVGYDIGSTGSNVRFRLSRATTASAKGEFEVAIRWDRVFSAQTDSGTYVPASGALPTSLGPTGNGRNVKIAILAAVHNTANNSGQALDQFLPSLNQQTGAGNDPLANLLSPTSANHNLTGVFVIDIDQDGNGNLDLTVPSMSARTTINNTPSVTYFATAAAPFWSNNLIRMPFSPDAPLSTGTTGGSALNLANYTVTGGLPGLPAVTVTGAAMGTGTRASEVFLTLSRELDPLEVLDVGGGTDNRVRISVSGVTNAAGTDTVSPTTFAVSPVKIAKMFFDKSASGEGSTFSTPLLRGSWDGFNFAFPITDGVDAYADVPGNQIEPEDTVAGDGRFYGRAFHNGATLTDPDRHKWSLRSTYTYPDSFTNPARRTQDLAAGYNVINFDRRHDQAGTAQINWVDPVANRLIGNNITVNFVARVPNTVFTPTIANDPDLRVHLIAGPNFGNEGAIQPAGNEFSAGNADVLSNTDTLRLTRNSGLDNADGFAYTGSATYQALAPDVSTFRLGYKPDTADSVPGVPNAGQRENDGDFTPDELPSTFIDNIANYDAQTIHGHIARLQQDAGKAVAGRTINFVFGVASLDTPPPPTDAVTASNEGSWNLYE